MKRPLSSKWMKVFLGPRTCLSSERQTAFASASATGERSKDRYCWTANSSRLASTALGQSICFGITCNFSRTLTHVITVSSPQGTCLLLLLRNNPERQASQASRELPLPPEQNNCLEKGAWGMYPAPTLVMQGLPAVIRCQKRRAGTPKQLKSKVGHTFFSIVTDGICAQLL